MNFTLLGQGIAVPAESIQREEAATLAADKFCKTEKDRKIVSAMYKMTGVQKRHSVLLTTQEQRRNGPVWDPIMHDPRHDEDPGPPLSERMRIYEERATPLAVEASRNALERAELAPSDITHVVTVTCSGFFAPGIDVRLIQELGLPATTERAQVGFMGCQGSMNGLRVARGFAAANPDARVLLCSVELCSIHYAYGFHPQRIVANALFADGAAAIVAGLSTDREGWRVKDSGACLVPDSDDAMSWRIRDNGFEIGLSPSVPGLIEKHLKPWVESWLAKNEMTFDDVKTWAVHPGGPRILGSVVSALGLPKDALCVSKSILQEYGNMSSPTILFILDRLREQGAELPCVALAFGPGLMVEGVIFE